MFVLKLLICVICGMIPGLAFGFFHGNRGVALAYMVVGAIVGIVLSLPGVSITRTMKLIIAVIVARNIPFLGHSMIDWADENPAGQDVAQGSTDDVISERLFRWLCAPHTKQRRGWLVALGLIAGLGFGVCASLEDIKSIEQGGHGILLPLPRARDSLLVQAIIATIATTIWGGTVSGMIASPAYRRPILFAGMFAFCVFGPVGFAVGAPDIGILFATGAIGVALAMTAILSPVAYQD